MKTPKPPKGYRVLRVGTIIQPDDFYLYDEGILMQTGLAGRKIRKEAKGLYFRKLKPKKGRKK